MEQRTNSPYPKIDRPVLAILGGVLVLSTVLFWWADRSHDWRYYQYAFRQQVSEKLGAERADDRAGWPAADLGRRPRPRRSLHDLPSGRDMEGLREAPKNRCAPTRSSR